MFKMRQKAIFLEFLSGIPAGCWRAALFPKAMIFWKWKTNDTRVLPPLGVTDRQHQGRAANLPGGRDHVGLWRERTNFSRRARPRERQLSRLCRGPKNANKRPNRDRPNPDHRTLQSYLPTYVTAG